MACRQLRRKMDDIVPYLMAGERLPKHVYYRLYHMYQFGQFVLVGIAGVGLASPWWDRIPGVGRLHDNAALDGASLNEGAVLPMITDRQSSVLSDLPPELHVIGLVFIAAWIVIWAALQNMDGQRRALLASGCVKALRVQSMALRKGLAGDHPLEALTIVGNNISQIVDRAIIEAVWGWAPLPTDEQFQKECDARIERDLGRLQAHFEDSPIEQGTLKVEEGNEQET